MLDMYSTKKTTVVSLDELPARIRADLLDAVEDVHYSTDEQYIGAKATLSTWYNADGEPVERAYRVRLSFRDDKQVHFAELFFDDNLNEDATLRQDMYFTPDELEGMVQFLDEQKKRAARLNLESHEMNLFPEVA